VRWGWAAVLRGVVQALLGKGLKPPGTVAACCGERCETRASPGPDSRPICSGHGGGAPTRALRSACGPGGRTGRAASSGRRRERSPIRLGSRPVALQGRVLVRWWACPSGLTANSVRRTTFFRAGSLGWTGAGCPRPRPGRAAACCSTAGEAAVAAGVESVEMAFVTGCHSRLASIPTTQLDGRCGLGAKSFPARLAGNERKIVSESVGGGCRFSRMRSLWRPCGLLTQISAPGPMCF